MVGDRHNHRLSIDSHEHTMAGGQLHKHLANNSRQCPRTNPARQPGLGQSPQRQQGNHRATHSRQPAAKSHLRLKDKRGDADDPWRQQTKPTKPRRCAHLKDPRRDAERDQIPDQVPGGKMNPVSRKQPPELARENGRPVINQPARPTRHQRHDQRTSNHQQCQNGNPSAGNIFKNSRKPRAPTRLREQTSKPSS